MLGLSCWVWHHFVMSFLCEDAQLELEALEHTYTEAQLSLEYGEGACTISLALEPRHAQQFLAATLDLSIGPGYPQAASCPGIQIKYGKGLGDDRLHQLLELLRREDASLSGELRLGHLCEVALSFMDDNNSPEGEQQHGMEQHGMGTYHGLDAAVMHQVAYAHACVAVMECMIAVDAVLAR